VGDSGKFEVRLPPGTWTPSVQFWYPTPQTLELPPQTVGTEDVRDMVLTGLRLHGTLLDSVTHDPRQTRLTARRKVTASQPDPFVCWADQTKEGYDFERIPAGDWILTAAPLRLAATGGEVQLHVEADEAERRLDLEVQAP
jgi:hypothetical protein